MAKSVKERLQEQMRQPVQPPPVAEVVEVAAPVAVVEVRGVTAVSVELPLGELNAAANSCPIHLDGVDLTRDQSNKLRRIALALDRQGAMCETRSGRRRVTSWRHAIRYILDQVHE